MSRVEKIKAGLPRTVFAQSDKPLKIPSLVLNEGSGDLLRGAKDYAAESREDSRRRWKFYRLFSTEPGIVHAKETTLCIEITKRSTTRAEIKVCGIIDITDVSAHLESLLSHRYVAHESMALPQVADLYEFLKAASCALPRPVYENAVGVNRTVPSFRESLGRCALCWEPLLADVAVAWDAFYESPAPRHIEPVHAFHVTCAVFIMTRKLPTCPCTATEKHVNFCFDVT